LKSVETPGVQHFGRITAILTPFNTLVHFGKIPSLVDLFFIILQNVANIFLLFPLVFALCLLKPGIRHFKKVLLMSFLMSLAIETTQAILDLLFDFNRVFEVDDLITNTLGGVLAYLLYKIVKNNIDSSRKLL
jgi:glycopeptide antibiotics resistance protein